MNIREKEFQHIETMIDRIDIATFEIINNNFYKKDEELLMEKINIINVCNYAIAKILGIYE